ncbi:hypothetical protein GW17_00026822 [Ensete ventricosum]|nr:hypothetical protein GW17_00026822 [Ensete ventricosum]
MSLPTSTQSSIAIVSTTADHRPPMTPRHLLDLVVALFILPYSRSASAVDLILISRCYHLPPLLLVVAFDRPHLLPSAPLEINDATSRTQWRCCPSLVVATSPVAATVAPFLSPSHHPQFFLLCLALPSPTPCHSLTALLPLSFPRFFGADHTIVALCSSYPCFCLYCHPLPQPRGQPSHCRLFCNQ